MTAFVRRLATRKSALQALSVLSNLVVPWALYRLSVPKLGETHAIMLSAAPPAIWAAFQALRTRRVDALSAIALSAIALQLVLVAFGGSPKMLLFRESLVTGLIGLVFIGSAIIRKPLFSVLLAAALRSAADSQSRNDGGDGGGVLRRAQNEFETSSGTPKFARFMTAMTLVCGGILVAETAVRAMIILSVSTDKALLMAPIVSYGAAALLLVAALGLSAIVRRRRPVD